MDLTIPNENETESTEKIRQSSNVATVLLISDEVWYCYSDTNMNKGKMYTQKQFQAWLKKKKKGLGDSLIVLLKPSDFVSYKRTVDALDYMTIYKIEKYSMVKMSPKEQELFPKNR